MNKILTTLNIIAVVAVSYVLYDIIRNPPEIEITLDINHAHTAKSFDAGYADVYNVNGGMG